MLSDKSPLSSPSKLYMMEKNLIKISHLNQQQAYKKLKES